MEENLEQEATSVLKFALFGPESTGKTTLAKQLAAHYNTGWVPEFARDYLQNKWNEKQEICTVEDMMPIALGQVDLENKAAVIAHNYLFCDTNLMVTKVFSEMYYDYCDERLNNAALAHEYELFFLTDIDVPWEKDDLRDKADGRDSVFSIFKQTLIRYNKPFITLTGDKNSRLQEATTIIDTLVLAKSAGFSTADFVQIYKHGIPFCKILDQLKDLRNPVKKIKLSSAATLSKGIKFLSQEEFELKAAYFDQVKESLMISKFTPASGAATRMFAALNKFLRDFDPESQSITSYLEQNHDNELSIFINNLSNFPFYQAVNAVLLDDEVHFDVNSNDEKKYQFIKYLLKDSRFNFYKKPKALIPFHLKLNTSFTPVEEHLYESLSYNVVRNRSVNHFTISPEHFSEFESHVSAFKDKIEQDFHVEIVVDFSFQKSQTDSIVVMENGFPLRAKDGTLQFKPGGHGALIQNLNTIDSDLIFIKNIDNVSQLDKEVLGIYKKALAGELLSYQCRIFEILVAIDNNDVDESEFNKIVEFLGNVLNIQLPTHYCNLNFKEQLLAIKKVLNRPIRICGMVTNNGCVGGGPFYTVNKDGSHSLQIVESNEVDLNSDEQISIFKQSTHFNPVDIVCGVKNFKGEKFDLMKYIDPERGFIVEKQLDGELCKYYEMPGLWNGSMGDWITVFVEVPSFTFAPVKTVNDLLSRAHQPNC